ncbi:MAG TPA: DUF2510 domain-containing protein [Streptosporangiaceae bacterium]|jgi:hypothetical protein
MDMPPPGWYEDPVQTGTLLRWWDGTQWTVHTAPLVQAPSPTRQEEQRSPAHEPVAALAAPVLADVRDFAASANDEVSLTEWFASIPDQQAVALPGPGGVPGRGGENSTQVLDGTLLPAAATPAGRGSRNTGALARLGWRRSALVTEENLPLVERTQYGGMLRRNRSRLMWTVALGTAVAMLITGVLVAVFGSSTAPHSKPAAATRHPAATHSAAPSPSATNVPSTTATTGTPVADTASGLSYALLAAPWQPGCPGSLTSAVFAWSAGENAVAGTVPPAGGSPWYASACSGLLPQQYAYTSTADLPQTAMNLVSAFDTAYFGSLPHVRATEENSPLQLSGHPGWLVEFQMTYQNAAAQGLAWQTQMGAVEVVDRGTGQPPAVLYVTVPNNLGTANIGVILASMQLAAPGDPAAPPAATAPAVPGAPPAQGSPAAQAVGASTEPNP